MQVAILGTGLLGASVGLAARRAGYRTVGWDRDQRAAERAAGVGALDEVAARPEDATARAEIVVLAAPLEGTLDLLHAFPAAPYATLVIDVASVQRPVAAAGTAVAGFVATHPLAGSERSGAEGASADLFAGRVWTYVPPRDAALESRVRTFVTALGAEPLALPAGEHDTIVAFTSHLPQVVSTVLGAMLAERAREPAVAALCGTGMRSMTRLAASEWSVWSGTLSANAPAIAQEVRRLVCILRSVADALETGKDPQLAAIFEQATGAATALARTGPSASSFPSNTPHGADDHRHDDSR